MASRRGGLGEATQLEQQYRRVLEPILDLLKRIVGMTLAKVQPLKGEVAPADPAAVLAVVTAKLNEEIAAHAETRAKVNELIARIQED